MRTRPAVALLILLLLPGCATDILFAGEAVSYQVGRETVRAYLANPVGSRNLPGIVVIHEMWGLNDQIRGVADNLSLLGYVVIAPDLYRGQLAADPGLAQEMMRALDENRAVGIVKGAVDFLRRLDEVSTRRVGTVGFGLGGRISLATGLRGTDVQSTVIVYGRVETTRDAVTPIKAPLLGIFAARDPGVPVNDVKRFETALKEAGKDAKIIIFNGVGHAFMNESRADFEPEIAKDAWVRMQDWLAVKLRQDPPPTPTPPAGP